MTGILNALIAGVSGAVKDAYFNLVSLLLPGNGTNGAQNNTFLDSSTNNFTITRNGNTTQGTFSPFSQNGWGNYFPGSSSIQIASNSAFNINTYDTLECWVNFSSLGTNNLLVGRESNYWIGYNHTSLGGSANKIVFAIYNGTSWQAVSSSTTPSVGVWYHILGVKDNTTLRMYVNGVQENTATFSGSPANTADSVFFGAKNTVESTICYISNARLITGASNTIFPYSGLTTGASFNSPTTPLTNVSGTSFLTCQSNRFKDNSSNTFTITVNGSPSVVAFSPFAPTAAYTTAAVGGSGYFDGTGDYLTVPDNASLELGSSSFTIQAWVYVTGLPSSGNLKGIFAKSGSPYGGFYFCINSSGVIKLYASTTGSTWDIANDVGTSTAPLNAWTHIALSRSGSNWRIWVNGASGGTVTSSATIWNTTNSWYICSNGSGAENFTGYLSDASFVIGSTVYDPTLSTITIPTAPTTAVSGTQLLLNYTNAGITDATAKNDLETVGNAQISTTQSKWGGGSIAFDGTGDYLTIPSSNLLAFGTGDFTVEFWVYPTSAAATNALIMWTTVGDYFALAMNTSRNVFLDRYGSTTLATTSNTLTLNTWNHVAVARSGTTLQIYINGTSGASITNSTNWLASTIQIGNNGFTAYLFGYLDDLRITKGYARYTSNFTAPTAPFPVQ